MTECFWSPPPSHFPPYFRFSLHPTSLSLSIPSFKLSADLESVLSIPTLYKIFFLIYFYLFIFDCVGSSSPCEGPLQSRQVGTTPHRGARASHHRGLSCCGAQALDAQGSAVVAHGPSRPAACGILPDQGPNPRPPHQQADSQPLRHQGSPLYKIFNGLSLPG